MTPMHDTQPRPRTAPETVRRVTIPLVEGREDAAVWDRLLARHHYLGRSRLVGDAELRRGGGPRAGGPRGVCPCGAEGRGPGRRDWLDSGSTRWDHLRP